MVRDIQFTWKDGELHLEEYPQAAAAKAISGRLEGRFASMMLHRHDLEFCRLVLEQLDHVDASEKSVLAQALWISCLTKFFSCFGRNSVRTTLSRDAVLREIPEAKVIYDYFQALRHKHIVHDENPYTQAFVCVVLNPADAETKVADVVGTAFFSLTVDAEHRAQMKQLVNVTGSWVDKEIDELSAKLRRLYEEKEYSDLAALPSVTFRPASAADVDTRR